ncbi:hypothetical protein ACFL29_02195 [Patescibacteria group bacterium]
MRKSDSPSVVYYAAVVAYFCADRGLSMMIRPIEKLVGSERLLRWINRTKRPRKKEKVSFWENFPS